MAKPAQENDFSRSAEAIARQLLGEPNTHLSSATEMRFGSRGSLSVDLESGTYFDHERGQGGGMLDLIVHRGAAESRPGAIAWLQQAGIVAANDPGAMVKRPATAARGRIVETYDYTDANGAMVFQVCRFEPKDFRQRRPDPNKPGAYVWNIKGVRQVPYRLPELLQGAADAVFVVEGERDADALRAVGLVATCNAGGAGKWPDELTPHFAGRRVCVLPDNDKPGRAHAHLVASKLQAVAREVCVLDLAAHWPGMPVKADVSDWLSEVGSADELVTLAKNAPPYRPEAALRERAPVAANENAPDLADDTEPDAGRPEIQIRNGERARIVGELAAVLAAGAPYYRRDAMLVRAISLPADEDGGGVLRSRGSVLLRPVKAQAVIADASRVAAVVKFDKRAKKMIACDLPSDVAQSFVELGVEQHSLPSIVGVVRCPIMREDGSLIARGGYDAMTQLILAGDEDWSALTVPAKPSRDDARAALQWLLETAYRDFPFVDDASRAVAVSALVTAIIRPAIDCAPVHAFSAPQFGAGKSLQASFAAVVATGQKPAMLAPGHDQQEFEKRVDAAIIAGDPVVVLDNLSRPLSGDNLCSAITSDMATVRPLGSSTQLRVRTSAFWMATGQNMSVKKDMHRRTVIGYIDARMERPETRSDFAIADLIEWAAENRMRILTAVYTMLRAHAQAGYPDGGEKLLGNFAKWSRRVAHCLVWLGMANPVRSQERLREDDPEIQNRISLFRALLEWQEGRMDYAASRSWTIRDLQAAAVGIRSDERALNDAIAVGVFKGLDGMPYWLRTNKNATIEADGLAYQLQSKGASHSGIARWEVIPQEGR